MVILSRWNLVLVALAVGSCAQEIDYTAKYCSGFEGVAYVTPDLSIYSSSGVLTKENIENKRFEKGKVTRSDAGQFYVYSGDMEFVAYKDSRKAPKLADDSVVYTSDHYIVEGTLMPGNRARFHIDFEGTLFRFDEILISENGDESVVKWRLCGGRFSVI